MDKRDWSKALALAVVASFGSMVPAEAEVAKARLIEKGVTAFECSIFAALMSPSGGEAESQRLFRIGYESAIAFLNAMDAGEVTDEEFRQFVRADVALNLRSMVPDTAFAVGRVYQDVRKFAADRVLYGRTATGAIDYNKPRHDFDLEAQEAQRFYNQARCALID